MDIADIACVGSLMYFVFKGLFGDKVWFMLENIMVIFLIVMLIIV